MLVRRCYCGWRARAGHLRREEVAVLGSRPRRCTEARVFLQCVPKLCFTSDSARFPAAPVVLLPSYAVLVRRRRRLRPVLPGDAAFRRPPTASPVPTATDGRRQRWCVAETEAAPFAHGFGAAA
ncbi:hypothetical protein MMPV_008937 [Pyropia vietnamensis]